MSCFYEDDKLSRIDMLDNNSVIQYSYQYSGEKLAKVTMKNAHQETVGVNEYTIDDNDSEGYPLTMIRSHLRFAQTVPVITKYIYEYTVLELK